MRELLSRLPGEAAHKPWAWWPLLLPPAGIGCVYLAHSQGWTTVLAKSTHEELAMWIVPIPFVLFAISYARARRPLHLVLAALTVALFCRECHFAGTGKGIYVALVAIAVWSHRWRDRLLPDLAEGHAVPWLSATLWGYFFSQTVARRVWRFLPLEAQLHDPMEELSETVSHLMLGTVAILSCHRAFRAAHRPEISQDDAPAQSVKRAA